MDKYGKRKHKKEREKEVIHPTYKLEDKVVDKEGEKERPEVRVSESMH